MHNLKCRTLSRGLLFSLFFALSVLFIPSSALRAEETDLPVEAATAVVVEETLPVEEPTPLVETPVIEEESISSDEEVALPAEETPAVVEEVTPEAATQVAEPVVVTLSPELSTDKEDYHPGETTSIFGKFFSPIQSFILKIFGSDENDENYVESVQTVTTDESGSFLATFTLDSLYRPFYEMVVSTLEGTEVVSDWFRDSSVGAYDQCSNDDGDGYATGNTGCRWITGAIGQSNSVYFEGDSTPQRVWLEGFAPNTSHTVTFKYGTTKGGKHAYDYLTTFNASENWIAVADQCDGITGCTTAAETTAAMQNDPNVTDTIEPAGASRLFTIRGGSITNVSAPSIDTGTYAGDSETIVTVTFTTASTGSMCSTKKVQGQDVTTCGVALWFGAHIANSGEWFAYDGGTGAGSINGNPYHVALAAIDSDSTSGGGRDNQMSAASIVVPVKASLTLLKTVITDNGGTAVDTDWTLSANGPTNISGVEGNAAVTAAQVDAGAYTLSESTGPTGYTGGTYSCVKNGGAPVVSNSLTLATNDIAVCTVTNDDNAPSLTLVKEVINDNGGGAIPSNWTLTATGYDSQSPDVGTYNLSESNGPSGYTQTSLTCSDSGSAQVTSVTLSLGENVTCTFVNNDNAPTLTLVKTVTNDNGGTKVAADFQGKIDGNNVAWQVAVPVSAGLHTASETNLVGYIAGSWGQDCAANGSVSLALGENKTCTITNDDQPATLIVKKVLINDNGGIAGVTSFSYKVNAGFDVVFEADAQNDATVNAGVYSVVENAAAGYTTIYENCSNLQISNGGTATCTITNNDNAPVLHLRKIIVNDNGGTATLTDFTLTANGTDANDVSGTSPVDSGTGLKADTFVLSETALAGYSASAWSCVGGTQEGTSITLGLGQEATCTITNDDIAPKLVINKIVVNDNGGVATTADFQGKVDGNDVAWTATTTLLAGAHTVSEVANVSGYAAGLWTGDCAADGSVSLSVGETKTCTITNDDIAPRLTVIKHVINDNGGIALASAFTLNVTGVDVSNPTFVGSESGTIVNLDVGNYSVDEDLFVGYAKTLGADCAGAIALGEAKICTITNDDIAPTLTLVKQVVNDNGGNAVVSDFPLFISGSSTISGLPQTVVANTLYTATETNLTGYAAGAWGGDCAANGTITLAPGENKTCTIANNDIAPKLTITKIVVNDNGGTKTVSDFPLFISSSSTISGLAQMVMANTLYTATETSQSGYTASLWGGDCAADGTITLNEGDEKTCTITNDDQPGHLIVNKVTVPADTTTSFSVTVSGGTIMTPAAAQSIVGGANIDYTVFAGTYSVNESVPAGWEQTSNTCTGVAVANGETKECTITNVKLAKITIIKDAQPNDVTDFAFTTTGTGLSNFSLDDDQGVVDGSDDQLSNTQTFETKAGIYSVTEGSLGQYWTLKNISCVGGSTSGSGSTINITANPGDEVTCTFVNEKLSPTRTQGFWQTHTSYTSNIFLSLLGGSMNVGSTTGSLKVISTTSPISGGINKLFGAYFSNIAKKTDNKQRNALEKARMQLLQQLVTAKLNCAAFGCSDDVKAKILAADAAYAGNSSNAIITSAGILDAFNNSGDTIIVGNAGKATPTISKSIADFVFWD